MKATFTVIFKNLNSAIKVMEEKYVCLTCGKTFYSGQGIILTVADRKLYFHSKACAYKFLKEVILNVDKDCISSTVKDVYKKYEELAKKREENAKKKI
jgi:DNA-directed RNA polymerase subunit RPC12/RpoP